MAEALWDGFSRAVSRQLRKAAATRSLKGRGKQSARSSVAIRHEDHELTHCRTLPPLPFRMFADAASARRCDTMIAAARQLSSDRSLTGLVLARSGTVLSPQPFPTIQTRTENQFAAPTPATAFCTLRLHQMTAGSGKREFAVPLVNVRFHDLGNDKNLGPVSDVQFPDLSGCHAYQGGCLQTDGKTMTSNRSRLLALTKVKAYASPPLSFSASTTIFWK